ncbi:TPA: glycosyltransferase family 2 protein [Photobacterium damselae]
MKVTVLIPVYNAESHVKETLESLKNQTLNDFEVLIVNDGSSDNSDKVIKAVIGEDSRFHYFPRNYNLGTTKTRNELLTLAKDRGEFVAWCDSDDLYPEQKLQIQYEYLAKNDKYIGCGTNLSTFGMKKKRIFKFKSSFFVKNQLLFGSSIAFPSFMHKNNLAVNFDESLVSSEDYDYLYKISKMGSITNISKFLLNYRSHEKQESTKNIERQVGVHFNISYEILKKEVGEIFSEKDVRLLVFPTVNNDVEYENLLNLFESLKIKINNISPLLDYRFIVYNKRNYKYLFRYLLKRKLKIFNVYNLFKG